MNKKNECKQFSSFRIAGQLYGADILDVREVITNAEFFPVYHTCEGIQGAINIRGQIHIIGDLRNLLNFPHKETELDKNTIIIFKDYLIEGFGLLVDEIGDVFDVPLEDIELSKSMSSEVGDEGSIDSLITSVCKLETELMSVVDIQKIVDLIKQQQNQFLG